MGSNYAKICILTMGRLYVCGDLCVQEHTQKPTRNIKVVFPAVMHRLAIALLSFSIDVQVSIKYTVCSRGSASAKGNVAASKYLQMLIV